MNIRLLIILAGLLIISRSGLSACVADVPARNDVFPLQGNNITVGSDIPLGTIIYRQKIHSYKDYSKAPHMTCSSLTSPPFKEEQYIYLTNAPLGLSSWQGGAFAGKIFSTNVPGIGVVISHNNEKSAYDLSRRLFYSRSTNGLVNVQMWADTKLLLVKTGQISPGMISGIKLPTIQYQDVYYNSAGTKIVDFKPYTFSFNGTLNVVSETCKTTDSIVELGSWDVIQFKKIGYSSWRRSDIKLESCPRFHGMVSGVTTDHLTSKNTDLAYLNNAFGLILHPLTRVHDAEQGIMEIQKDTNYALGVGIQVALENDAGSILPVTFDVEKKIDAPTDGSRSVIIPLKARYVKIDDVVTPGPATGRLMFTINYY